MRAIVCLLALSLVPAAGAAAHEALAEEALLMQLQRDEPNATERRIERLRAARKEAIDARDNQRANDIADAFHAEFPDESPDYPTKPPHHKPTADPQILTEEPQTRLVRIPPQYGNFSLNERVQVVGLKFFPGGVPGQRIMEGARVWLVGLTDGNATWNGAFGTAAGWDEEQKRFKVAMDDGSRKLLAPVHVALAPADETPLNGQLGSIVGFDENTKRWQVMMDDGNGKLLDVVHLVRAPNVIASTAAPAERMVAAPTEQTKHAIDVAQQALKVATEVFEKKEQAAALGSQQTPGGASAEAAATQQPAWPAN